MARSRDSGGPECAGCGRALGKGPVRNSRKREGHIIRTRECDWCGVQTKTYEISEASLERAAQARKSKFKTQGGSFIDRVTKSPTTGVQL
jgi:transcriptional regulator NrdR family protein